MEEDQKTVNNAPQISSGPESMNSYPKNREAGKSSHNKSKPNNQSDLSNLNAKEKAEIGIRLSYKKLINFYESILLGLKSKDKYKDKQEFIAAAILHLRNLENDSVNQLLELYQNDTSEREDNT